VDKQHGTFASVSAHRVSHCSIVAEESGGPEDMSSVPPSIARDPSKGAGKVVVVQTGIADVWAPGEKTKKASDVTQLSLVHPPSALAEIASARTTMHLNLSEKVPAHDIVLGVWRAFERHTTHFARGRPWHRRRSPSDWRPWMMRT